jgi:hypothetical protein
MGVVLVNTSGAQVAQVVLRRVKMNCRQGCAS